MHNKCIYLGQPKVNHITLDIVYYICLAKREKRGESGILTVRKIDRFDESESVGGVAMGDLSGLSSIFAGLFRNTNPV